MHLGRVLGTVVATKKVENLEGLKLLTIQPLNHKLEPVEDPIVALDTIAMAGHGDIIYYTTGREASMVLKKPFPPVDAAVIGFVDEIDIEKDV
ncbi:MAG: ethanolamine utilization protein EutN [Candidatus Schekmanbacteria bacterium RBG_13_48_7]|uniref:Ethanolamine utilization protein EutN n=1 Tax=Candidatus Schekmanbacteria bacterium RBG_13_48_7 TaxID=1817878 RepID=A0A1F7RMY6_9BACT|nr:MAG: ethanolamine utilization protein EutN [Candidatus Schekmanbacteria bacterium RBG_13_48_7]